jgi:hypothetical protein
MTRADGRGVDRLDLTNPDPAHQLDVLIAGRGDNPQTNGMSASLDNFAPRVGAIYRFNDKTVFRAGYGLTFNATPWARAVRGDNDYPITIASSFFNALPFAPNSTLAQGIPLIVPPDQSTGRVPLDLSAAEYTPEINNIDRGEVKTWNIAVERRLMLTRRSTWRTSARRARADTPRSTSTHRRRSVSATRDARMPRRDACWRSTRGVSD